MMLATMQSLTNVSSWMDVVASLQPQEIALTVASVLASAVISWLLAWYYFVRQWRPLRPFWAMRTTVVVREKVSAEGLVVTYNGRQIATASVSRVAFWNSGLKELVPSDVGTVSGLAIHAHDGVEILNVAVVDQPSEDTGLRAVNGVSPNTRRLEFAYIGRREGVLLKILHTGTDAEGIQLTANFRNARLERVFDEVSSSIGPGLIQRGVGVALAVIIVGILPVSQPLKVLIEQLRMHPQSVSIDPLPLLITLAIIGGGVIAAAVGFPLATLIWRRRRLPARLRRQLLAE